MNIRTALAGIALVELLTLAALGYYAHQLHQLHGRRSLLASKNASPSTRVSSAGNVSSASPRAEEGAPSHAENHQLMEAQAKQQQVQQSIQQLEKQIREQQERFAQQQTAGAESGSVHEFGGRVFSTKTADFSVDRDRVDEDDDDDDVEQDSKNAAVPTAPASALPKITDSAFISSVHTAKVTAGGVLQSLRQEQQDAVVPSSASSASSQLLTSSQARVQGAGDYEVLWHDGKLHARQFKLKEAAYAFYDTLGSETAHRLSYQGVEVKRHVWADAPWPSEWLPAPNLPSAAHVGAGTVGAGVGLSTVLSGGSGGSGGGSVQVASVSMLEGRGKGMASGVGAAIDVRRQQNVVLNGVGNGAGMAPIGVSGGGGAGWGLDRYQGMNPVGGEVQGGVGGLGGADRARSGQEMLAAAAGGAGAGVASDVASMQRIAADGSGGKGGTSYSSAGIGGGRFSGVGVSAERPDAATVGKVHRAPAGQYVRRTEVRLGGGQVSSDDVSISTHLSCDRIDRLESYFRRWPGPIVAALYIKDTGKDEERVERLEKLLRATRRDNYHFILVYPTDASLYPANLLRNVALEPVATTMVFLLDIDLIPDVGFYPYIKSQYRTLVELADTHVFTIPAFQGLGTVASVEAEFPVDKEDLVKLVADSKVKPILSGQQEFWEAFKCLNYDKWYVASEMYLADYRWPCEPYLLGKTTNIPLYDERFVHYGNDKAQHVLNIFYKQYRFGVLPAHFLLHWTHALAEWADDKKRNAHMGEIMELTEQFKFESGTEAGVNWHTGHILYSLSFSSSPAIPLHA